MAKDFKSNLPLNKFASAAAEKPKKKVGRPVSIDIKGAYKSINVAVPKDKLELVNEYALAARKTNLTEYIRILISNDLEKNLDKYKAELTRPLNFD